MYEDLLRFVFRVMTNERSTNTEKLTEEQMVNEMTVKLNPQLIIWASDEVLREYSSWRREILPPNASQAGIGGLFQFGRLLIAIRKDVGQPNKDLGPVDVLRVFVNDIDSAPILG